MVEAGASESLMTRKGVAVGNEVSARVCGEDITDPTLSEQLSKWLTAKRQLRTKMPNGAL